MTFQDVKEELERIKSLRRFDPDEAEERILALKLRVVAWVESNNIRGQWRQVIERTMDTV